MDNFCSEKTGVPECVLLVKWLQKDKTPEVLSYKMELKGTGEERNFFRILFDPGQCMYMYMYHLTVQCHRVLFTHVLWTLEVRMYLKPSVISVY